MGTVLFWVHDRSVDAMATRLLVASTVPIVVRAIEVSRLPELRSMVTDVRGLLSSLRMLAATGSVLRDLPDPAGSEGQT
jgi:hypothetical protein